MPYQAEFSLFDIKGQRKYLNSAESKRFLACTEDLPLERALFCQMIYFTGARISEVSEMKVRQIDFAEKTVILRTLKQRKEYVYRVIPLPDYLMGGLLAYIDFRQKEHPYDPRQNEMWWFSTRTGSRIIKAMMKAADISPPRDSARGLRHGFAVHAATTVPLPEVQVWLGHADIKTTGIYLKVSGKEARAWAEKMWAGMI